MKLFERGAFGAEPTVFGRSLAKRAKLIVAETRLATAELDALKGAEKGFIKVGFGWSFLPRIAPLSIERFRRRRPGVTVKYCNGRHANAARQAVERRARICRQRPTARISD